jgi:hypothetical protein
MALSVIMRNFATQGSAAISNKALTQLTADLRRLHGLYVKRRLSVSAVGRDGDDVVEALAQLTAQTLRPSRSVGETNQEKCQ